MLTDDHSSVLDGVACDSLLFTARNSGCLATKQESDDGRFSVELA